MNLSEFKAWFGGFTEGMTKLPNAKQWARIQERVAEITPDPTPYPVFIDRYVRPYWTTWNPYGWSPTTTTDPITLVTSNTYCADSFTSVGRAEALSISA